MSEYRVYQNLTTHAITVEANSKKEAIKKAQSKENFNEWDTYEATEENVFFDAVKFSS